MQTSVLVVVAASALASGAASPRATTDDCPFATCTAELTDLPFGSCSMSRGKCVVESAVGRGVFVGDDETGSSCSDAA